MNTVPSLETSRLLLRGFVREDLPSLTDLLQDRAVSDGTLSIPHPYTRADADAWFARHATAVAEGSALGWAITARDTGAFMGSISLHLKPVHRNAETGYWLGTPFWGQGYTTEALRRVLQYAFDQRDLHRVYGHCFSRNPASGRVMEKAGLRFEGELRAQILKDGEFLDLRHYGILHSDPRP